MSYDLRIWEQPRTLPMPKTVEDAGRLMLALEARKPGANPKFVQFAQKLVARYPSRDMYAPGDPDANDAVWMGNPVEHARNGKEAVFAISLPELDRPKIMRFVVQAANELGLTVFDDQLGMAFLPGGKVLPEDGKELWDELEEELESAPEPWTKAEARKELVRSMTARLRKHGFAIRKLKDCDAAFFREAAGANQEINFYLNNAGGEHASVTHFIATHDLVKAVYDKVCGPNWSMGGTGTSLFLTLDDVLGKSKFVLGDRADVELLGTLIEAKVIPVLDRCRTVKDLDKLFNVDGVFPVQTGWKFSTLIVARLAGNPNFDALAKDFPRRLEKYPAETREKLAQLTAHLIGGGI